MRLRNRETAQGTHGPVRVLHIVPSVSAGGIESLVVSLWENVDKNRVQFDIAALNPTSPVHQERLEQLGAGVHFIGDAGVRTSLWSKVAWRVKAPLNFAKLLAHARYDVVHIHLGRSHTPFTLVATLRGVPMRIVHAHNAGAKNEGIARRSLRRLSMLLGLECLITHRVGCSNAACTWLWGRRAVEAGKAVTIYNAVDVSSFRATRRQSVASRANRAVACRFVNVGRYSEQKNQSFLLDVFASLSRRCPSAHLDIVGFGPLEMKLRQKADQLGVADSVVFNQRDTDIPALLAQADYFLLPSLHEGFGIVAVEAQVAGVPVFVSDAVTREIDMGLAEFIPLEIGPEGWASRITKAIEDERFPAECSAEQLRRFDIREVARQWERLYETGEAVPSTAIG